MNESIQLSFLKLTNAAFQFTIYRKSCDGEKPEGMHRYRLPTATREGYDDYYVSFTEAEDCFPFVANSSDNINLTKKWLMFFLSIKVQQIFSKSEYIIGTHFIPNISFVISSRKEGKQLIQVEPYYLETIQCFGFLLDYKFKPTHGYEQSKAEKILSFSLSPDGSKNKNFYSDKLRMVKGFIENTIPKLFPLQVNGTDFDVFHELTEAPVFMLAEKTYIFKNGEGRNQFQGIKTYKPLENKVPSPLYIFIFEQSKINTARQLVMALRGQLYPTFSGMEKVFDIPFSNDHIKSIIVDSFSKDNLHEIETRVDEIVKANPNASIVGIFAGIEKNFDGTNSYSPYYTVKSMFLKYGLAVQAITIDQALKKDGFKWSISGIALQLFVKLGGVPWKVKPQNKNCLIFGISSAHIVDQKTKDITKYFAYSLCFDSSGLYKRLHILGRSDDRQSYISQLAKEIKDNISSDITKDIDKCVIHVPFKLKRDEMRCIADSIDELKTANQHISFSIIKVNVINKFFGYSHFNSHIPLAGSCVKLAEKQFLIWFEGLQQNKTQVVSAQNISNPVHVEFIYGDPMSFDTIKTYLQDIINLSGANWRGFNAKHEPVTTLYPELIAKFAGKFDEYGLGLQIGDSAMDKVWFI